MAAQNSRVKKSKETVSLFIVEIVHCWPCGDAFQQANAKNRCYSTDFFADATTGNLCHNADSANFLSAAIRIVMDYLVEIINLRKQFGSFTAVDGISFGIEKGICFGLLGPNGAGKTTTIEMIEGITTPSSGEILYRGKPRDDDFPKQIGIQFQSTALMDFVSVREVLQLFSSVYPRTLALDEVINLCQLEDILDRQANRLSGGQKQRLLLALALINDPDIVFLDEPTTGLDPQARRNFWNLAQRIKAQGKTILLTTHYMDEAEILCDELVIVDRGKIIAQGSPQALLDEHLPNKRVQLNCNTAMQHLSGQLEQHDDELIIHTASVEKTLQELIAAGADLSTLRVHNPTLEDLFLKLTGHKLRE
jgi:ABC-2 type transport system ATP-binding protein